MTAHECWERLTPVATCWHGTQVVPADEQLAVLRSRTTTYYEQDALESVTSLTSSSGSVAGTYSYDSFGNLSASTGTVTNPFRYTGREWDSEVGLYSYRERVYDPSVGRFVSEDPIRFTAGNNFYDYVYNDPTDYTDPSGLKASGKCCNPKAEAPRLKRELAFEEYILGVYESGHELDVDQLANSFPSLQPGAATTCDLTTVRGHPEMVLPPQPSTTIYIDRDKFPCLYNCTLEHEKVHQKMCTDMGAVKYNALSEAAKEMPAYRVGIRCIRKILRSIGL
jgi:RHS repeat-associated protein